MPRYLIGTQVSVLDAALYMIKASPKWLRGECERLWGCSSEFYFRVHRPLRAIANPNLHDIPTQLPFRVEMWDRHGQHIRWVIAASASVAVGHAALDAAIAAYPGERFTLRNGVLVIRHHDPTTA